MIHKLLKTKALCLMTVLISALLLVMAFPNHIVLASVTPDEHWSDEANRDTSWTDGAISTPQQLAQFAYLVNTDTYAGENRVWLERDIDLVGKEWTPIGMEDDSEHSYDGLFDGNNFTLHNITITKPPRTRYSDYGLFGMITGIVQNVTVTGKFSCKETVTGYFMGGIASYSMGKIINCTNEIDIEINTRISGSEVGGIVGANHGEVIRCTNNGNLYLEDGNAVNLGGIAGRNRGIIDRCSNSGDLTGYTNYSMGGISAENEFESLECRVSNCYNTGTITFTRENTTYSSYGGVVGISLGAVIENCYNVGLVRGLNEEQYTAGLAGHYVGYEPIHNSYYLDTSSHSGIYRWSSDQASNDKYNIHENPQMDQGFAKTDSYMRSQQFVDDLNADEEVFYYNAQGYPTLSPTAVKITVKAVPTNASIVVSQGDTVYNAESDGTYLLTPGNYTITVSAAGFRTKTVTHEVTFDTETHTIFIELDTFGKLTIRAADITLPFGNTLPELKWSIIEGTLLEGENISTGSLKTDADIYALGVYTIVEDTPFSHDYYNISFVSGTLTIVPNQAMQAVIDAVNILPNPIKTREQADAAATAVRLYNALTTEEQKAVAEIVKDQLETAQKQSGAVNHTHGDISISGLPWNIRVIVERLPNTNETWTKISGKLKGKELLALYNITLTDTLTGKPYILPDGETVKIIIGGIDLTGQKAFTVFHVGKDGVIETIAAKSDQDGISFTADSFSLYGVAVDKADKNTSDKTGPDKSGSANPVTGDYMPVGVLLLVLLASAGVIGVMKKRQEI